MNIREAQMQVNNDLNAKVKTYFKKKIMITKRIKRKWMVGVDKARDDEKRRQKGHLGRR